MHSALRDGVIASVTANRARGRASCGERVVEYSCRDVSVGSTVNADRRIAGAPNRGCEMRTLEGFRTTSRFRTALASAALVLCAAGTAGCDRTTEESRIPASSVTRGPVPTLSESVSTTVEATGWFEATSPIGATPYVVPERSVGSEPASADPFLGPTFESPSIAPTEVEMTSSPQPGVRGVEEPSPGHAPTPHE